MSDYKDTFRQMSAYARLYRLGALPWQDFRKIGEGFSAPGDEQIDKKDITVDVDELKKRAEALNAIIYIIRAWEKSGTQFNSESEHCINAIKIIINALGSQENEPATEL